MAINGNAAKCLDIEAALFVVAGNDQGQARHAGAL
jgi:hypothetical protein